MDSNNTQEIQSAVEVNSIIFGVDKVSGKKLLSSVLADGDYKESWHETSKELPPKDTVVAVRISAPIVVEETNDAILHAETMKLARLIGDPEVDGAKAWVIEPPYLAYDYSPVDHRDQVNEISSVTHWTTPTEEDVERYKHRLDIQEGYDLLRFEVGPEYEEIVYLALLTAMNALSYYAGLIPPNERKKPESLKLAKKILSAYNICSDLQACIDKHAAMVKGEQIPISKLYADGSLIPEEYHYTDEEAK